MGQGGRFAIAAMVAFSICWGALGAEAQDSDATEPAWGLVITGGSLFITAYAGSVGMAFIDSVDPVSAVPFVGPWVALEALPSEDGWTKFGLGMCGAWQMVGALFIVAGVLTRRTRQHRAVSLSPYASDHEAGLVLRGVL